MKCMNTVMLDLHCIQKCQDVLQYNTKAKRTFFFFCFKCQQCDKTFINSTFLQNHMQRRHPEEYEIRK